MIEVLAPASARPALREFFELLKIPWRLGPSADAPRPTVVLCDGVAPPADSVVPVLVEFEAASVDSGSTGNHALLRFDGRPLPIYQGYRRFSDSSSPLLTDAATGASAVSVVRTSHQTIIRVGYSLHAQIQFLLSEGQPAAHAAIPTLDLHVDLLRQLILRAGQPLVEIPPVPAGHSCLACLTHDVDHPSLRLHRFDHTLAGYVARGTIGSALAWTRGRVPAARLARNLGAVVRLPLVLAGAVRDPWLEFDHYLEIEGGRPSTFFVIPERGSPGRALPGGEIQPRRAAAYRLQDVAPVLRRIRERGGEVGVHGIDAWSGAEPARREKGLLEDVAGPLSGVRMHWLYFDPPSSPGHLEQGGFSYDSTVGYNETVGFRVGTSQAYRPPGANDLLELPLHIMDTSMFYPSYLNLAEAEAGAVAIPILDHAALQGGAVTINWHDRSLFPERQWGDFYAWLIQQLDDRRAWFASAHAAVAWFNRRRKASFAIDPTDPTRGEVCTGTTLDSTLPPLTMRLHRACRRRDYEPLAAGPLPGHVDQPVLASTAFSVAP